MSFVAMTDSWPGYWGAGETEEEAYANLKKASYGKKPGILIEVDEFYRNARVHPMGYIECDAPEETEVDRDDWPKVEKAIWRVGPRGAKTPWKES